MTKSKREPFAVVETEPKQAHEARVKEEIEAMRLKTIRMCADKADRMGSEEIRNAILFETLPTELEGK